jgi:prolyl oligopeptidase
MKDEKACVPSEDQRVTQDLPGVVMFTRFEPPTSDRESVIDCMHGIDVSDPYRWLEDPHSPRTRVWIDQQCAYAGDYFSSISAVSSIRERVSELLAYSTPADFWSTGDRYFFLRRQPGAEQPSIVAREGLLGRERVLVDPAARGNGNGTAVGIVALSEDARFLAYSVRDAGTDHSAIEILDTASGSILPDS